MLGDLDPSDSVADDVPKELDRTEFVVAKLSGELAVGAEAGPVFIILSRYAPYVRLCAFNKWRSRCKICLLHEGNPHFDPFLLTSFELGIAKRSFIARVTPLWQRFKWQSKR